MRRNREIEYAQVSIIWDVFEMCQKSQIPVCSVHNISREFRKIIKAKPTTNNKYNIIDNNK